MADHGHGFGKHTQLPQSGDRPLDGLDLLNTASRLGLLTHAGHGAGGFDPRGHSFGFDHHGYPRAYPHPRGDAHGNHGTLLFIDDPWCHIDPDTREYVLAILEGREPKYLDRSAAARRRMDEEFRRG